MEYTHDDQEKYVGQKYINAEFDENECRNIFSHDSIIGNLNKDVYVEIAELHVDLKAENGNKNEIIESFDGMFVVSRLDKKIPNVVKIIKNTKKYIFNKKNNNEIELDDAEFEKYFDVHSNDRNLATRILTADVMRTMTDYLKNIDIVYEITIKDNNLYLRFYTERMFEPKIYGKVLDKEQIYTYYNILKFIVEITEKINSLVRAIEV